MLIGFDQKSQNYVCQYYNLVTSKIMQGQARELLDEFKRSNIRNTWVPEGQGGNPNDTTTVKDIAAEKF